ncbi:prominin-1-A-like [Lytechinus pictus]|uniref:prominin-1-A-like n=1 Tax=Lytechinus pictus TaxID=7653 RepID=UPI0030B9C6F4
MKSAQGCKPLRITLFEEVSRLNASIAGIEIVASDVFDSVSTLADFIQDEAGPIVVQGLETYIDSILLLADQFIDEVLRRIQDDMGRCGIVRNIYDAVVGSLCLFFLPGLNVFWFALSAVSFALIPSIVFKVRLAKYLRRPTHYASQGEPIFNGVAVYPPTPSGTPQSSTPGTPLSMRRGLSESLVNIRIPRSLASKITGSGNPESHN